jgi:hypothetical protein
MPSIVLWCHECGLQWDAVPPDREAIVRALEGADVAARERPASQDDVARAS